MSEQKEHEMLWSQQENREMIFACQVSWALVPAPHRSSKRSKTAGERVSCTNGRHKYPFAPPSNCHALAPHQGMAILFVPYLGKEIPSKQVLFPQRHLQRTDKRPSTRSTYLSLRVQVCRISRDAELHCSCFYGNYSYRYSSQPGNMRDKSKFKFLLLYNQTFFPICFKILKRDK